MPLTGEAKKRYMREYMRKRRAKQRAAKRQAAKAAACPPVPAAPAEALDAWCADTLKVPPGHPAAGKAMALPEFGRMFFRDALRPEINEALLCVARKNAKSAIVAAYLLARLAGPLRVQGYRAGVVSVSREKAAELWAQCRDIAEASGLDGPGHGLQFRKVPRSILAPSGRVDVLSADRSAGHASGFDDAIVDELGLFPERSRELVNGMRSAVSARDGRFWALSIRGDGPFIPEILARDSERETAVHLYSAPRDCDLDDRKAWAAANPGLGTIKSERYMETASRRAILAPADQAAFRAYDLNAPLDPARAMICDVSDWRALETDALPERKGQCYVGIDLGGSLSMSAAVAYWPESGRLELWAALPDVPALRERSISDGVRGLYEQAARRGELRTYPGRVTDLPLFLGSVAGALSGCTVARVGCDRYRKAEALQALEQAGVRWPITWRGTGAAKTADGSHDVRSFQRAVMGRRLSVRPHLLMRKAVGDSALRFDAAGNPALAKHRSNSRIDLLSAAVIAAGLAEIGGKRRRSWNYRGLAA